MSRRTFDKVGSYFDNRDHTEIEDYQAARIKVLMDEVKRLRKELSELVKHRDELEKKQIIQTEGSEDL